MQAIAKDGARQRGFCLSRAYLIGGANGFGLRLKALEDGFLQQRPVSR
ncbi:hypothetical protein ACFFYR_20335 [Paraburkholderia dipogonis]|nr:hypothetical protein [Paraburkholderia dipogonis]